MRVLLLIFLFFLVIILKVEGNCCVFHDGECVYFDLGNWEEGSMFCGNAGADFYDEKCNELNLEDCEDGWSSDKGNIFLLDMEGSSGYSVKSKMRNCEEDWKCIGWKICNRNGKQKRYCVDLNRCNSSVNKPEEVRDCVYEEISGNEIGSENENENVELERESRITGAAVADLTRENSGLIGIVSLVVIVLVMAYFFKFVKK